MSESTARRGTAEEDARSAGMSLRVYTVNKAGTITSDTGTMRVDALGIELAPLPADPPCGCPGCRGKRART
ncbi:hypothetical protein SALBM135S_00735 [Streptomyces alboniger]